jgi:hypothetical protein
MNIQTLDLYKSLLSSWLRWSRSQDQPDPTTAKVKLCLQLLKAQQKQTGETIKPAAILSAVQENPIPFPDLFQRIGGDKYRWQLLQDRNGESTAQQIKKPFVQQESLAQIEEIYLAYPRKIAKAAALKAIRIAVKRMQERDANEDAYTFLLERTRLFAASADGNKGRFTPHPATWFNQERYLDDEQEWNVAENRSGNLKRDLSQPEDTTPGMSDDDL